MLKYLSKAISLLFHPLFVLIYLLLATLLINPYLFSVQDPKSRNILIFSVFMITVVLPLVSILMMRFLGLLTSLEMHDKMERVGPLIATGIFYLWLYVNIRSNSYLPTLYQVFVLGSTISLFVSFFINSFTKISLHTVGAGGLIMAFVFLHQYGYGYAQFNLGGSFFSISTIVILAVVIFIAGLIGACRMYLRAHNSDQLYMGYLVGFLGQLFAYNIIY